MQTLFLISTSYRRPLNPLCVCADLAASSAENNQGAAGTDVRRLLHDSVDAHIPICKDTDPNRAHCPLQVGYVVGPHKVVTFCKTSPHTHSPNFSRTVRLGSARFVGDFCGS